jgi:queuosine precursor transporter
VTTVAYVLAIVAANLLTAHYAPADIGPFLIPWGTWLIGATFILRDFVQRSHGRRYAYGAIAVALIASALTSHHLGDTGWVTIASALAFAVSEATDTEVYTRMIDRARFSTRIAVSGLVSIPLDTLIFVTVGLSPLTTGFVTWSQMPNLILGQLLVKWGMQLAAALIVRTWWDTDAVADPA